MDKYYAIYDNQLDIIRGDGFNSRNLEEIREELVNFILLGNFSEEGKQSIKNNSLSQLLDYYEFTLLSSNEKLSYDIDDIEQYIDDIQQ